MEYRKLHDDVECLGKLSNFRGYVFKDRKNQLHFIHSDCMEDFATSGDKGYIYYRVKSNGADHVFRKSEVE